VVSPDPKKDPSPRDGNNSGTNASKGIPPPPPPKEKSGSKRSTTKGDATTGIDTVRYHCSKQLSLRVDYTETKALFSGSAVGEDGRRLAVVFKHHTHTRSFERELMMLQAVGDKQVRHVSGLVNWGVCEEFGDWWMPYFREWEFEAKKALVMPEYSKMLPKLTRAELLKYGRQLLEFLSDMQGARLVHLDIRPQNITLDLERDEIRVIDFETGRNLHVNGRERLLRSKDSWGGGMYKPPELDPEYGNGDYWCWEQSDAYSVGITLLEWVEWVQPENDSESLRLATRKVIGELVKVHPLDRWTGARALEEWKKLCESPETTVQDEGQENDAIDVLPLNKRPHTDGSDPAQIVLADITNLLIGK